MISPYYGENKFFQWSHHVRFTVKRKSCVNSMVKPLETLENVRFFAHAEVILESGNLKNDVLF